MSAWTAQETAVLRRVYPFDGLSAVASLLPHRSREGIRLKACALNIRSGAKPGPRGPKPKTAECVAERAPFVPPADFLLMGEPDRGAELRWRL